MRELEYKLGMNMCMSCLARGMADTYPVHSFSSHCTCTVISKKLTFPSVTDTYAYSENATRIRLPRDNALGNKTENGRTRN